MSIVSKKQRPRPAIPTVENETSTRPGTKSRPKRRRLTVSAVIILGLTLLVGLLPPIIAHTPLVAYSVRRTANLEGTITFRSASVGWFSPTSVSGIQVCDGQGETVLEADRVTCDRSLLKLLFNSSNVGLLRIEKPRLSAKLGHDGSNVEAVLARWLNGQNGSSRGVDLSVEVVDGEATIVDQETQQSWHVIDLQFALDLSRRLAWPTRIEAAATIDDGGHSGSLAWKSHLKASETPPADPAACCGLAGTDGDLSLQTTTLPLALFQRLAARAMPGLKLDGTLGANLEAQWTGLATVKFDAKLRATQLVMAGATWNWSDPAVELNAAGCCDFASSKLQLDSANLVASTISLAAKDAVCSTPGNGLVQVNGTLSYDWDKLNQWLQPYCGTSIQFSGTGTTLVDYRGPLAPARGEGSAALQFSGANVYGFQVGPGELKLQLANGVLRADSLEVACNQGRLALQPEFRMDRQPAEFRLSAGTLARQIQLDQAACRSALQYVVPVLAAATQSQGQFSIRLDGCRIPIGDWNRAEIAGRIIVHSATMSPGPLVRELTSLMATPPSLVRIQPESEILFRMTGGRIYHQGLTLEFPELTMRTYGSVGLDDSLKLMVETSVPLAWLPSNAVTDAIRKQKMQVPLGGTLRAPQLDRVELARVKSQIVGNLGVLRTELGNQLDRFIQPKK
jgi:hypothetical protein